MSGALTSGVSLLERAIGYALGGVAVIQLPYLSRPTPCAAWNLATLLQHVTDSLDVLQQTTDAGAVLPGPDGAEVAPVDLVTTFRQRASHLLGTWTRSGGSDHAIAVGNSQLLASTVICAGAIEIAVHGWDIYRSCGLRQPIPVGLATEILDMSADYVTDGMRSPLFGPEVLISPGAGASDRLVAFLGRDPYA